MIFIVSFGLNSAVAAACEEKRAFDQVRVLIGATLATGVPLGNSSRDGLARAVSQLNILAIFPVLAANNQAMHAPFLKNVLDEVALLGRTGRGDPRVLSAVNIEKTAQILEELCAVTQPINQASIGVDKRLILERFDFNFTNPFRGWTGADVRSYFNLSLVFFVLLGLISLIVFVWKAYVLAVPFFENRKLCKIPAALLTESGKTLGHVTLLAPYGARFIPLADDGSLDADDAMHGADVFHLEIGERQLKVRLEEAMSEFSIVAFQTTLSRKELDALYAMSEILTRFASNVLFVKKRKPQTRDVRERNANPKMRKAPAL